MTLTQFIAAAVLILSIANLIRMAVYLIGSDIYSAKLAIAKKKTKRYYTPTITIIVPAHNEESTIEACLDSICANIYPKSKLSIIVANDGSKDSTKAVVNKYIKNNKSRIHIRLMNLKNKGKAAALNNALKRCAKTTYVMCLDADSSLDKYAIRNGMQHFSRDKRVVALAANVNIVEDGTMLNLVQRFEYIVCYQMKKAEVLYNIEYIVGGIGSIFKRTSLAEVGNYDTNTMTEDIDVAMKLISNGNKKTRLAYASDCIAYTQSAQTLKALMRQRFRWKYGRLQTFLKNKNLFLNTDAPFARQLTVFMLPFALLQELLFLIEPLVVGYILTIIFQYKDFVTFISAFSVIMLYLLFNVWSSDNITTKERLKLSYAAPPMYFLLYILSVVEYFALIKSIIKLPNLSKSIQTKHVTWKSPERRLQV